MGGKVGSKLEKLSFFSRDIRGIVPIFAMEGYTPPFLHVLDPNSSSFYLKCPRKCQKTYNFDIFKHFPKFTPPPPRFGMNPKFDHIPLCVYY